MQILYYCDLPEANFPAWDSSLKILLPGASLHRFYGTESDDDLKRFDYALVWEPKPGLLAKCTSLKAIFSLAAGLDHIFADPYLPKHVPVIRMVEPMLTKMMADYVQMTVTMSNRNMVEYVAAQKRCEWAPHKILPPFDTRVGIMGLGVLGGAAAKCLADQGYQVAGWSRSEKNIDAVESFFGPDGLGAFLARTDILVCMLPLTDETSGILNSDLFAQLPMGARLINVGRGAHLVEADLIAALDSGQLKSAMLDVFETEPLPQGHAFWSHPKILLTPHIASVTRPPAAAEAVAEHIRRIEKR